jgi:hypothetical protein
MRCCVMVQQMLLYSRIRVTPTFFDLLGKRDLVLHPNGGASPSTQEVGQAPTTAITLGAFQHRSLPDETQFYYQRYAVAAARGGSNQPSDIEGALVPVKPAA